MSQRVSVDIVQSQVPFPYILLPDQTTDLQSIVHTYLSWHYIMQSVYYLYWTGELENDTSNQSLLHSTMHKTCWLWVHNNIILYYC